MKLVAEYLEKAIEFEGMAAQEKDAKLEADPKKAGGGLSQARSNRAKQNNSIYRRNRSEIAPRTAAVVVGTTRGLRCGEPCSSLPQWLERIVERRVTSVGRRPAPSPVCSAVQAPRRTRAVFLWLIAKPPAGLACQQRSSG